MQRRRPEEQAVIDVIQRESTAFWMKDEAAFLGCHALGPDALRWGYWQAGGSFMLQGTEAILPAALAHMRNLPRPLPELAGAEMSNVVVHVGMNMAWARFDRAMPSVPGIFGHGPNGTIHILSILERIEGEWLIVGTVILDPHLGNEVVVRVDREGKIAWKSQLAINRLIDDPNFIVRNGQLRLRERRFDARLKSAIAWAVQTGSALMPQRGAVPLVIDRSLGATRVSWVLAEGGGHALVLLDDLRPMADRIGHAAQIFDLSPAQTRLTQALVSGRSMADFANDAGTTLNTVRTHLRRVFEKTGASSQATLVATLLSLTPPR